MEQSIPPVGRRSAGPDAIAPDGSEIRFLIDQRHRASAASMVEVTLPAGQVSRPVQHQTVEEVWYILEGQGRVWRCSSDDDPWDVGPVAVAPGDALAIPTGWRFQFSAAEEGPLRFLCVTIPPWPGLDEAQPADYGGLGPATVCRLRSDGDAGSSQR